MADLDELLGSLPETPRPLSWRTARLSDWTLLLGNKRYDVHTAVLGDGAHCSEFLHAQFAHWEAKETNLSELLPSLCWPAFESVLDFSYTGVIELSPENAVLVFKIAHVLQMRVLAQKVIDSLKLNLRNAADSRIILAHALQRASRLSALS